MKKIIFLFGLLLVGTLTISAGLENQIMGKWYVQSLEMEGNNQEFSTEFEAPTMDFQEDNVLILGEPGSDKTNESKWTYDKALGILHLGSFGDELEFKVTELTDSKLVLKASNGEETVLTMTLRRHLSE